MGKIDFATLQLGRVPTEGDQRLCLQESRSFAGPFGADERALDKLEEFTARCLEFTLTAA
jgi:hypothetical protein